MTAQYTKGQWPDAITAGEIRYHNVPKNCGMGEWYALSDASHGIPVFGSVRASNKADTVSGVEVNVFNYPGQTEQIAAELVKRWNAFPQLLEALKRVDLTLSVHGHIDAKTPLHEFVSDVIFAAEGAQS